MKAKKIRNSISTEHVLTARNCETQSMMTPYNLRTSNWSSFFLKMHAILHAIISSPIVCLENVHCHKNCLSFWRGHLRLQYSFHCLHWLEFHSWHSWKNIWIWDELQECVFHRTLVRDSQVGVALFDISISNIDCRYIDTFEKYRYWYWYRYGHSWKYRYRYRYRYG